MARKFSIGIFLIEITFIVLFGLFTRYDDTASPQNLFHDHNDTFANESHKVENPTAFLDRYYPSE